MIAIVLLIFHRRRLSLTLLIACLIINLYIEYFAINIQSSKNSNDDYLTIATHNIYSQGKYLDTCRNNPYSLYSKLKDLDADVIILQEYDSIRCNILTEWLGNDGYKLYQKKHLLSYGENAIYSRCPISNIRFENDGLIMYGILSYNGHQICIINCHLCSNNINEKFILNEGQVPWLKIMPEFINKIKISSNRRKIEVLRLRQMIDSCYKLNMPLIIGGDMNDVGGSEPIKIIEGEGETSMFDAWWHSGNGIGNTYNDHGLLHFRLDHIFYSTHFEIINTQVHEQPFSDHEILISKFKLK